MSKIHIYFMPGLAAGPEIFERLELPSHSYELHFLTWKTPLDLDETITNYAMRMTTDIKHPNAVLVGVSFGGIIVQEMSKFIETKKIIIISSQNFANIIINTMKLMLIYFKIFNWNMELLLMTILIIIRCFLKYQFNQI